MSAYTYLQDNCPKLLERMKKDEAEGKFNFIWEVAGEESQNYIGQILGRRVEDTETIKETWDEAERKL